MVSTAARGASVGKNSTIQTNRLRECQVRRFRIETWAFVAREGVFGWIEQRLIPGTGISQHPINRFASHIGNVRVLCPEDHQQFTTDLFCAGQRSSICVLTQLAVMYARPVVTDCRGDVVLERSAEREMAADAETHDTDSPYRDLRMFGKPVQTSAAILIEMRDQSLRGVLLAAGPADVIEWNHCSWRFDAAINFRGSGDKSVPGQPNTVAQQWRRKLKNIGIAPDPGILTLGFGRSDESSHRGTRERNVRVFGSDDHLLIRGDSRGEARTRQPLLNAAEMRRSVHQ